MPEPKNRPSSVSQTSQAGKKRGYESQAQSALRGARLVSQTAKPGAVEGTPGTRTPDTTLVEKLIAFLQDMD